MCTKKYLTLQGDNFVGFIALNETIEYKAMK